MYGVVEFVLFVFNVEELFWVMFIVEGDGDEFVCVRSCDCKVEKLVDVYFVVGIFSICGVDGFFVRRD